MLHNLVLSVLLLLLSVNPIAADDRVLVEDRAAACVIVVGEDEGVSLAATVRFSDQHHSIPSQVLMESAEDLAEHLNALGGIWDPRKGVRVVQNLSEPDTGVRILLGSAAVETYGLQDEAASIPYPGYVIRTVGDDILIFGSSNKGTANGVYGFLQDVLGVRWFGPQPLFRVVPQHDRVVVPDLDQRVTPSFIGRKVSGDTRREHPNYQWLTRRMRMNESIDPREPFINASHNLWRLFPPAKYYKEHPEYYAMHEGVRMRADQLPHAFALCWSNPDVVAIATEAALAFFRAHPDNHSYSLGINDGKAYCEDPRSVDLQPQREYRNARVASDMYFHFVNQVARAVAAEFPDRYIGVIAYNDVTPPPLGPIEKNVHVVLVCDISEYYDTEYRARDEQLIQSWLEKDVSLGLYYYSGLAKLTPAYFARTLAEELKLKHSLGFNSVHVESGMGWPWHGPMTYVEMRLLWDIDLDVDALLDEYFSMLYGPAATPMAELYSLFENIHMRPRSGGFLHEHYKIDQFRPYNDADLTQIRNLLDEAHASFDGVGIGPLGHDGKEAQRVAYVSEGLKVFLEMLEGLLLADSLGDDSMKDDLDAWERLGTIARINELLNRHDALYRETITADPTQGKRFTSDTCTPVRHQWQQHLTSAVTPALATLIQTRTTLDERVQAKLDQQISAYTSDPYRHTLLQFQAGQLTAGDNRVVNPGFEQVGQPQADGTAPPDTHMSPAHNWNWWQQIKGAGAFETTRDRKRSGETAGVMRGVGNGCYLQTISGVKPGDHFLAETYIFNAAEVTREDKPAVKLEVRWRDATGKWTAQGNQYALTANEVNQWIKLQQIIRVPEGAAFAVVMVHVSSLFDNEAVYVDDVAFRQLTATNGDDNE